MPTATFHMLRQQIMRPKRSGKPLIGRFRWSSGRGHIGCFVVAVGGELDKIVADYNEHQDDYMAILAKSAADRLAEALAEHLHRFVRKEAWGYSADEAFSNQALIGEEYQGIRPHRVIGAVLTILRSEPSFHCSMQRKRSVLN